MIDIKLVPNKDGVEEVIVPTEINLGKLYRVTKENDLVITFGNKIIKQLMVESVQGWARRSYRCTDIMAEYEAIMEEELEDLPSLDEESVDLILSILETIENKKEKERMDAIKVQMQQYAECCMLENIGVAHYPIRMDENYNVLGFEKGEEVKIIEQGVEICSENLKSSTKKLKE